MKIKPDFKAMTAYDWKYFTREDYTMYKDILLAEPYDPKLAEFFYEQKKLKHREEFEQHSHLLPVVDDDEQMPEVISAEEEYIHEEERIKLLFDLGMLSNNESERLLKAYVEGKTYKQIAAEDGVSLQAVGKSVLSAIRKLRKKYGVLEE